MSPAPLPFDPIERAARQWDDRYAETSRMRAVTSLMRVHQLVLTELDELLRPLELTFARYEVLVLLSFSRRGELPLGRIGERLQVHATSVTSLIQRLAAARLVQRRTDPSDGRVILASLTDSGRDRLAEATTVVEAARFGLTSINEEQCDELSAILASVRRAAGDF